jgi:hypothetical protein
MAGGRGRSGPQTIVNPKPTCSDSAIFTLKGHLDLTALPTVHCTLRGTLGTTKEGPCGFLPYELRGGAGAKVA